MDNHDNFYFILWWYRQQVYIFLINFLCEDNDTYDGDDGAGDEGREDRHTGRLGSARQLHAKNRVQAIWKSAGCNVTSHHLPPEYAHAYVDPSHYRLQGKGRL